MKQPAARVKQPASPAAAPRTGITPATFPDALVLHLTLIRWFSVPTLTDPAEPFWLEGWSK